MGIDLRVSFKLCCKIINGRRTIKKYFLFIIIFSISFFHLKTTFAGVGEVVAKYNLEKNIIYFTKIDFGNIWKNSDSFYCLIRVRPYWKGLYDIYKEVYFFKENKISDNISKVGLFENGEFFREAHCDRGSFYLCWSTGHYRHYVLQVYTPGKDGKIKLAFEKDTCEMPEYLGSYFILTEEKIDDGNPTGAHIYKTNWDEKLGWTCVLEKSCKWPERYKYVR